MKLLAANSNRTLAQAIGDYLDGYSKKVQGVKPHPRYDLADQRLAEKAWFS